MSINKDTCFAKSFLIFDLNVSLLILTPFDLVKTQTFNSKYKQLDSFPNLSRLANPGKILC